MKKTDAVMKIEEAILNASKLAGFKIDPGRINVEHPADETYGDLATSVILGLAKETKSNPKELAEKLVSELTKDKVLAEMIKKIETAGPGFINFTFREDYLLEKAEEINYGEVFEEKMSHYGNKQKAVVDYSAPNIAKPFGIGHLRSTNIGQAIYNLYKVLGFTVIGDNHLGDWGTQFGKLIVAIKKWGDKPVSEMTIGDLEKLYVRFHAEAEKDETLIDLGREWFAKLESGDKEARKIWQECIDISIEEFDRVYRLLGVKIDFAHGESFYEKMLPEIIEGFRKKKLTKISEGAEIIEFDNMPPAILVKSNGATTYFTRDMATIKYRMEEWNPDLMIYEVGADQQLHFKHVFAAAKLMGWEPTSGFVHIGHGLIRWKTGKFSTRKGDTIHLEDVINKAMEEAMKIADSSLVTKEMDKDEKEEMVKKVAIGAVKFSDLSSDPKKDIVFDWDQIMSLEGDSGPYLQYTLARALSVLNKSEVKESKNYNSGLDFINQSELRLLREFAKFEEKIVEAANRYAPSVLADYLLSVARKYNEFYANNKIIGTEQEVFRLFLTRTTASILDKGLAILGIDRVEKM